MDTLHQIEAFVVVVQAGSHVKAADQQGTSKGAVAKRAGDATGYAKIGL